MNQQFIPAGNSDGYRDADGVEKKGLTTDIPEIRKFVTKARESGVDEDTISTFLSDKGYGAETIKEALAPLKEIPLVPGADTSVPVADTSVPVADTSVPVADTPVPGADTPVPVADTPVPVADTPVPGADTPVPVADTPVPGADILEIREFVTKARESGVDEDTISTFLSDKGYVAETIKEDSVVPNKESEKAVDLVAAYDNINFRWGHLAKTAYGYVFNDEMYNSAQADVKKLNEGLRNTLHGLGVNAYIDSVTGTLMMKDDAGKRHNIEPGFFDNLWAGKFELSAAVVGALRGASIGARVGASAGPVGLAAGTIGGGLIGGGVGAATGSGLDYINASLTIKEDLDYRVALSKMVDAGIADVTMGILFGTAWKTVKYTGSGTLRLLENGWNTIVNGNKKGAEKILKKITGLSEKKIKKTLEAWSKIASGSEKGLSARLQAMRVISQGQKEGMRLLSMFGYDNRLLVESISRRAKELMETATSLTSNKPVIELQKGLIEYEKDVRKFYRSVVDTAEEFFKQTDYSFDPNKMNLRTALMEARNHIADINQIEQYKNIMKIISKKTTSRTFSNLLDLRQTIISLKNKADSKIAHASLQKSIAAIDREIVRATNKYMPNGVAKVWREELGKAKHQYTKMKQLQQNVLFRAITRSDLLPEGIIKRLGDAILKGEGSLNDSFVDVMSKLPEKLRHETEGAIIKQLTENNTTNYPDIFQAVNFPKLAHELKKYTFESPEAKQYMRVVQDFAAVFQNDVNLGVKLSNIPIDSSSPSSLAAEIHQKVRYSFISKVWEYMKQLMPGDNSRIIALGKLVIKLAKNPMNAKDTKKFITYFPKETQSEISKLLENFRNVWGEKGLGNTEDAISKQLPVPSDKPLAGAVESAMNPIVTSNVDPKKIASLEDIANLIGKVSVTLAEVSRSKSIAATLKRAGYVAVEDEGRTMFLDRRY